MNQSSLREFKEHKSMIKLQSIKNIIHDMGQNFEDKVLDYYPVKSKKNCKSDLKRTILNLALKVSED